MIVPVCEVRFSEATWKKRSWRKDFARDIRNSGGREGSESTFFFWWDQRVRLQQCGIQHPSLIAVQCSSAAHSCNIGSYACINTPTPGSKQTMITRTSLSNTHLWITKLLRMLEPNPLRDLRLHITRYSAPNHASITLVDISGPCSWRETGFVAFSETNDSWLIHKVMVFKWTVRTHFHVAWLNLAVNSRSLWYYRYNLMILFSRTIWCDWMKSVEYFLSHLIKYTISFRHVYTDEWWYYHVKDY